MTEPLNRGAALPQPGQRRWYKIISPTKGNPLSATILGDTFTAIWTHYVPPSLPCTMNPDCHWCRGGLAPRYNGYVAAGQARTGEPKVLALTYHACCQFTELLRQHGTLRGMVIHLKRLYPTDRSPLKVTLEKIIPSEVLPPDFDVIDSLTRMWGVNEEYLRRGCRRLGADETAEKYLQERLRRCQTRSAPPTDPEAA